MLGAGCFGRRRWRLSGPMILPSFAEAAEEGWQPLELSLRLIYIE
jgi:hypothetical protein